jgi:hypothetical protein
VQKIVYKATYIVAAGRYPIQERRQRSSFGDGAMHACNAHTCTTLASGSSRLPREAWSTHTTRSCGPARHFRLTALPNNRRHDQGICVLRDPSDGEVWTDGSFASLSNSKIPGRKGLELSIPGDGVHLSRSSVFKLWSRSSKRLGIGVDEREGKMRGNFNLLHLGIQFL